MAVLLLKSVTTRMYEKKNEMAYLHLSKNNDKMILIKLLINNKLPVSLSVPLSL